MRETFNAHPAKRIKRHRDDQDRGRDVKRLVYRSSACTTRGG